MRRNDTSDLHRRQQTGQAGHAVLATQSSGRRWRALWLPVVVTVLGLLLAMWGPLPGLGVLLIIGGVMGLAATAFLALLDGLS